MTGKWELLAGVALPALAVGLWLANVTPAHGAACTGAVDVSANSTTCTGGSTNEQITYVDSNAIYSEGDFTLRLNNHDVTAGGLFFSGTVADTDGALGEGDGFIILENGSDVTNMAGNGIDAFNFGAGEDLTIDLRDTSTVSGSSNGIVAEVRAGNIVLTTGANVAGGGGDGINATATGSIVIRTNGNVTGGDFGIAALSTGGDVGNVTITTAANASVIGRSRDGVQAIADDSATVTANGIVSGEESGVFAVGGTVTVYTGTGSQIGGTTRDGIHAKALGAVAITTGVNSSIGGGNDGINAVSDFLAVTVVTGDSSSVTGAAGDGIDAQGNFSDAVTITTGALSRVSGVGGDGILARSASGAITVTMNAGAAVDGGSRGIAALSEAGSVLVRTGAGSEVNGNSGEGIIAASAAGGTVAVTIGVDSAVSGGNDGIFAESVGGGGAVSVGTGAGSEVNGDIDGIDARSVSGALSLATGAGSRVTGIGGDGIQATSAFGAVTITTGQDSEVEGASEGIAASTRGSGTITITNNGETVGSAAGIEAVSETGAIRIINTGTITNLSRDADDLAIHTAGGAATIDNDGIIRGRIETGGSSFVLNNAGIWTTSGASDFAGASDTVNNRSVIFVGADAAETMSFAGLETLNNAGRIDLRDRVSGDGSNISDRLQTSGDYVGQGNTAELHVDAFLGGPGSVSDVLAVGKDTSGVTRILVNNTNLGPGTLNTAGILVVDVAGVADEGDFVLANGPIDTGFFVYDLVFNNTDQLNDQFLLVSSLDGDVFETLATVASSQAIWRETANAWEARQQTVRDRLAERVLVTAVADPALPGRAEPELGLWFSGLGSWAARDTEISGFDIDYDQSISGFVAGADFGVDLGSDGTTLLFGLLAGYVDSSLNFDQSSTSIKTDGATFGVYASLIDGGFFANILVKADRLGLDYSAPSLPVDAHDDTEVNSIGGRTDIGYRFGEDLFIEPMLSLDAVSTSIEEFSVGGADIDPGTNDSIRGGAGVRAGFDGEIVRASITGRVWDVFSSENEVDLTPAGPALALSDDTLEGIYGEVTGQVDLDLSSGTVLFARGSLLLSDDITKPAVSGGLSFFW